MLPIDMLRYILMEIAGRAIREAAMAILRVLRYACTLLSRAIDAILGPVTDE